MDLYTVCCDTLEFDVELYNEDGTAYTLGANDKLWFCAKKSYSDTTPAIYVEQHSTHFEITPETEVPAGVYMFEIGILFENGTEKTVIKDSRLHIDPKLKGHTYE